jgi:hypothetical protein
MPTPADFYHRLTYHDGNPFLGTRLKIKRAERHLRELANAARQLPMKRGYRFLLAPRVQAGQVEIVYQPTPMPLEFAAVIGDATHNIRSAFEFAAVALTIPPIGKGKPEDAYFPTGKDRGEFEFALTRKMKGAPSAALRLVEELEPYPGGKFGLRALHELDNLDKHKLLIPSVAHLRIDILEAFYRGESRSLSGADFRSVDEGKRFVALIDCPGITSLDEFRIGGKFKATLNITFRKGQPFEGQAIVPTLLGLVDVASGFVEKCENLFMSATKAA